MESYEQRLAVALERRDLQPNTGQVYRGKDRTRCVYEKATTPTSLVSGGAAGVVRDGYTVPTGSQRSRRYALCVGWVANGRATLATHWSTACGRTELAWRTVGIIRREFEVDPRRSMLMLNPTLLETRPTPWHEPHAIFKVYRPMAFHC